MPDVPPRAALEAASRLAIDALLGGAPALLALADRLVAAGHEVALVGGSVRDAILRPQAPGDLDLATSARPDEVLAALAGWADATWDVGIAFGTVGARRDGQQYEITTYRADAYDRATRKPEVTYGDSLLEDLRRRDFTINAMAVTLPDRTLVDPFDGLVDLAALRLRTPATPEESFADDPLRMMRAARFAAQLQVSVAPEVRAAMTAMAERITMVSAERVRDELSKLLLADRPRPGIELLVESGLADHVLPELPALRLEIDEHHRHKDVYEHSLIVLEQAIELERAHEPTSGADLVLRLAALLHDIGKPRTRRFERGGRVSFHHHEVVGAKLARKRLAALRYPNAVVDDVAMLVELHLRFHGYGSGEWTDAAVRRYVRDAQEQLVRLHKLTRADCTTRNARKAAALRRTYDDLERRIGELAAAEELAAIRPDLDGNAIMAVLGIAPGREVGEAYRWLLERRLDEGPLGPERAEAELRAWWAQRTTAD
ncbi:MAG: CCA tRNA nucleotidyltransferase [Candidatus Nanopelagicales bacterium]|nr:CCA tRNA nucleotidyltransferase [Candidatus Nanopelagicales bacterium]